MKIFLDTNIFLEYIEERQEVDSVEQILEAIANGKYEGCLSQGLHTRRPIKNRNPYACRFCGEIYIIDNLI